MEEQEPRQLELADQLELVLQAPARLVVLGLAPRTGAPAGPGRSPPAPDRRRDPPIRDTGIRGPASDRSRAARRAARSPRRRPDTHRSERPSPRGRPDRPSRSRAFAARSPRASRPASRSTARPGAPPAMRRACGRRRWQRTARQAARRARTASDSATGRAARTAAAARPGTAPARRRPTSRLPTAIAAAASAAVGRPPERSKWAARAPSRAHPDRHTSPPDRSSSDREREGGGRGSRSGWRPSARVRLGDQPAEIPPPVSVLDQQRHVEWTPGETPARDGRERATGRPAKPDADAKRRMSPE